MDEQQIDRFARAIAVGASRRRILSILAAGVVLAARTPGAAAARASCAPGQVDCGGVCVDTCCNNEHCGACGNACPPGLTCFEGVCDCPRGDCPPVTPPQTGAGTGEAPAGHQPWFVLALASLMAAVAARWGSRRQAS
jgi:hypothetical protein